MKTCRACYILKEETDYYKTTSKQGKVYHSLVCKKCTLDHTNLKRKHLIKQFKKEERYKKYFRNKKKDKGIEITYDQLMKVITKRYESDTIPYEQFIGKKVNTNCYHWFDC